MVQQLTSFTALFCCKEPHDILIHSVCFCPYFRFSSSKTKLLNFRLWVYCVNPHVVSWNPWCIIYNIYIYIYVMKMRLQFFNHMFSMQSKASLQFFCHEMVGQEQRTAPDAAEQAVASAEAQAQQKAGPVCLFMESSWRRLLWWFQACMFCSVLHADAVRCRYWNKSFQKLRWLVNKYHEVSTFKADAPDCLVHFVSQYFSKVVNMTMEHEWIV